MKKSTLTVARNLFFLSALTLGLTSCEKDEKLPEVINASTAGIFVTNEGGFTKNEGALSFINLDNNAVTSDVYASNNGEPLGDIAQTVTAINGKLYVVVNNSAKVVVVNPTTFKKVGQISGLGSPNNIAAGSSNHAYVTDLFGGPISVVNLTSNTVEKSINCPGSTGEMLTLGGKTYVTNSSSEYLFIINHNTDAISDSILIGKGAESIQEDASGNLWLGFGKLYDANYNVIEQGKIKKVSPSSKAVTLNLPLVAGGVKKIRMDKDKTSFYFINKDLFKMSTSSTTLPTVAFFSKSPAQFYGLGVDVNTNTIYVSDPKDYVASGSVYQVNSVGALTNTFAVGIIPGDFYFMNK